MSIVYLNGEFIEQERATVSIMDRGMLFGDGVYEVIPAYHGHAFLLQQHLARLHNSLNSIYLQIDDHFFKELPQLIEKLIELNGGGDMQIYLQITRGSYGTRKHSLPSITKPTVILFTLHNPFPDYALLSQGIAVITLPDLRWKRCDVKAITLLPNILLNHQAEQQGAVEVILINDGHAIEGSSSNLFIVKNDIIITPPKGHYMLGGITRDFIVSLAREHHLPIEERMITTQELSNADEIWVTNSTREIRPVIKLNDQTISGGAAGPYWEKMYHLFQQYKQHYA